MKKTLLFALVFTGMLTSKLSAQEVNNTVKINPLSALFRIGSVFYERKMSDNLSLQLGVAYTGLKLDETKFSGFSTTPELRYYPKANALNGLYFGPFLRYQNYTVKDDVNEGSYTSFGGGAVLGRQWVYKSGFTLDLFFGPSYNAGKIKADDGSGEPEVNGAIDGFGLRAGIAIGFGF